MHPPPHRDTIRHEYVIEFDPLHPDADPETGMREWTDAEKRADEARVNGNTKDAQT